MKLHRYYILSIIVVILTAISFDTSLPMLDNTTETKIEVSLEEKESKKTSDEKLIAYVLESYPKEIKLFAGFDLNTPLVNQLYLYNIFKPPKFS